MIIGGPCNLIIESDIINIFVTPQGVTLRFADGKLLYLNSQAKDFLEAHFQHSAIKK